MTRQAYTRLIEDLDGSDAADTVRFGYGGNEYEVDLCGEHLDSFEDFLAPYIEHGRRVRGLHRRPRGRSETHRRTRDLSAIRRWAREQGYPVRDRGRIADETLARYDETH